MSPFRARRRHVTAYANFRFFDENHLQKHNSQLKLPLLSKSTTLNSMVAIKMVINDQLIVKMTKLFSKINKIIFICHKTARTQ